MKGYMNIFSKCILSIVLIPFVCGNIANAGLLRDASRAAKIAITVHVLKDGADNVLAREKASDGVKKVITILKEKYPETADHIMDAQHNGHPAELTIDRAGARARRVASLSGKKKIQDRDLDEYPPALFKEGGKGASVRPISRSDNRGSGACIGNQCRSLSNGDTIKIEVK